MTGGDEIVVLALELFREAGVEGEIYLERSRGTTIAVHDGKTENLVQRSSFGAGLRVLVEGRMAFAFTADLGRDGLARAIATARGIAAHTKRDDANVLPALAGPVPALRNRDAGIADVPIAAKIEIARETEAAARAESPRIQKVREASYQDFDARVWMGSTRGGALTYEASRAYAGIDLAATEGETSQTGSCVGWALGPGGLAPREVGREGARRALRKLGARQPATARTSVVLDPEAAAGLFGALAGLFSADAVLKERSLFAGHIGEVVASPAAVLVDDGRISGGCSSSPVDGEGTPTGENVLIEGGRLRGYFHSLFTARKMNVQPTGNGVRGGYGGTPDPSPTNLYLKPTGLSRNALLASVDSGVYVTDWMGLHTVNTTTGEFSLGASGIAIEKGELTSGLDRKAIAGNVIELLKSIEAVADDLAFLVAGGGATTLLRGISVGGA